MDDVVDFANRDDLPVLTQAAIAHAQFESIHPFTDGNGRIGRALINAILRRRRTTTRVVVPLASALAAHRDRYFDVLGAYRAGELEPLISSFAAASRIAVLTAMVSPAIAANQSGGRTRRVHALRLRLHHPRAHRRALPLRRRRVATRRPGHSSW